MKINEILEGIKGGLAGAGVGAFVGKSPKAAMLGYQLGSGAENLLKKKKKKKEPEDVKETATSGGTAAGAVATSMGAGNGFLNGGPGVLKREPAKKRKRKTKKA